MLTYFSHGTRRYYDNPMAPQIRRNSWEFQIVARGAITRTTIRGDVDGPHSKHLWLSRKGSDHSWTGIPGKTSEIVVFHFQHVPEPLPQLMGERTHISIPLSDKQVARVRELAQQTDRYWRHPSPGMMICLEHVLMELSLLVFEHERNEPEQRSTLSEARVEKALSYFSDHLTTSPSLVDVAKVAGTSPAHLRRHFHEVLQIAPKQAFEQIRFQRVLQLMSDTDKKLSTIADECGFTSPSTFSRAFKLRYGIPPEDFRLMMEH